MAQNIQPVKRDKLAILLDMLQVCRTPVKKTHILYKANINFYQLTRYLNLLSAVGMIETVKSPFNGYRITEKGSQLINMFERADDRLLCKDSVTAPD